MRRRPFRGSYRRARVVPAFFLVLGAASIGLVGAQQPAQAADDQHGIAQVVLNPGGGHAEDGSDGLRIVLNSTGSANQDPENGAGAENASDQLWFADTVQYCCGGVGPNLSIGGVLYGESGAASSEGALGWDSLTVVGTSGAVVTGTTLPSTTGGGTAHLQYAVVKGELTYVIDRTVSYTYPNDYYRDTYSFRIPAGNTEVVKFYKGGDTAPGSNDEGYGIQLTSPVRSVISLNPTSHIQVGQREVPGDKPFDGATAIDYSEPYADIAAGNDLGFQTDTDSHDAGFQTQWNLGSTPGTQTYTQETFVNFQGASLTASFRSGSVTPASPVMLDLNVVNTALSSTTGIGYTFSLPSGLRVASGTPANDCGGTLTAAANGGTITLASGTAPATSNCVTSVPVVAASAGTYTIGASSVSGLAAASNGVGTSSLTVAGASVLPSAPTSLTAVADRSAVSVSWQPPTSGSVVRYRVTASPGSASCLTTGLSCVLGGVSGVTYTITVTPLAADDVAGTSASITTSLAVAAPEIPSSPPADAPLDLTTDRGDITTAQPGQTVTVIGTGFLPYSTVSIVIYSTPVNLGMATTDANGAFTKTVTVPSSLAAGSHSLVAYGVDPSGNLHSLRMNVTVPPAAGSSGGSNRALAYTGLDINPLAFVVAGGGLLLAGLVLLVVSRTRRQEAGDGAELVASGEQEKAMAEVAAP